MPLRVLLPLIVLLASPAASAVRPLCAPGRFVLQGYPLIGSGRPGTDAVILETPQVSIRSGCAPVEARVWAGKRGTRIKAAWPRCGEYWRRVRLNATIDAATCETMTGAFRFGRQRYKRSFSAARAQVSTSCTRGGDTFALIEQRVFAFRGCTVTSCHGVFGQASLDLLPGSSYENLVGVPASNPAAAAAGALRILPGHAAESFLSQKLHGTLADGEGARMPLVGLPLPQAEIDLIDAWIDAGAPRSGVVAAAPCLPEPEYVPTTPTPPPPGGYQLVLDGPTLAPGEELEGCLWMPVPNPTDLAVGKWEFFLNPGTHHFAIFPWDKDGTPPVGVWQAGDVGCVSGAMFGNTLSGSPQAPYFIDLYAPGIARLLRAGTYIGLNAHYANNFDVPIQMKVWTNVYPYPGTPEHIALTITDFNDMFTISVPPFTQKVQPGRFTNEGTTSIYVLSLSGHMHKRGLRFTARWSDGSTAYENFDWSHPVSRPFEPPVVLAPGDWVDFECLHDNGVTRPVKRDGSGNPTTLTFGLTTDGEMCVLVGTYY